MSHDASVQPYLPLSTALQKLKGRSWGTKPWTLHMLSRYSTTEPYHLSSEAEGRLLLPKMLCVSIYCQKSRGSPVNAFLYCFCGVYTFLF